MQPWNYFAAIERLDRRVAPVRLALRLLGVEIFKSDIMAAWRKKKPQLHIPVRLVENVFFQANWSDPQEWEVARIVRSAKRRSIFPFRIQSWLRFSPSCLPSEVCWSCVLRHRFGS
jgi:hypothetical protein